MSAEVKLQDQKKPPHTGRRRLIYVFLLLAGLLVALLVFTDWWPVLRGPAPETGEWYWPYLLRPVARWWPAVVAGLAVFGLAGWWLGRPAGAQRANRLAVAGLVLLSLGLQLAFVYADRPAVLAELVDRTLSVRNSGYFWTAAQIDDLPALLRTYPAAMPTFESEHARTHPPGLILANYGAPASLPAFPGLTQSLADTIRPTRCTDLWLYNQPAAIPAGLGVWAVLPLLLAALSPLPAFDLGRRLFGDAPARLSAVAVATMPALLLFVPQSDQLFVPLTLFTWLLFHLALARGSWGLFFTAGLLISLSSFLTIGNVALLLPLLVYAALWLWRNPQSAKNRRQAAIWALAFGGGVASIWLAYWLSWGVAPWEIARVALQQHYELVTQFRNYAWWLGYNLVDLLTFVGVVWVLGYLWLLGRAFRRGLRQPAGWMALAILLLIIVLNVSGSTRGETGRLWLFFTPLIALTGAGFLATCFPQPGRQLGLLAVQLMLLLGLGLAWRPTQAVIVVAQEPDMMPVPAGATSLNITFPQEPITLESYTLQQTASALELTLVWSAQGIASYPYTVFTHLQDSEGNIIAQQDNWPGQGQWPPSCWTAGDMVVDPYRIELPERLPAGEYTLTAGVYNANTNARLLTISGNDLVFIETIPIP